VIILNAICHNLYLTVFIRIIFSNRPERLENSGFLKESKYLKNKYRHTYSSTMQAHVIRCR